MQQFFSHIKNILSHKWATITILIVAILSRTMHLIFFFNIRVDRNYQLLATQNFVHGDGITTAEVLPANLSEIIYTPLIKWPPGYSLLLSPFYSLSGNNYLFASLSVDLLFGVILLFVSRAILKLLDTPLYLINIFTLTTSFFIYYFYFITSSDAIATTFFIIALYYTLCFLKTNRNWAKTIIPVTLFLFVSALMKYLFMPVVFVIPVFLVLKGFIEKNRSQANAGLVSGFILVVAITVLLLYQKNISGASAYVSDAERGFFPANLLSAYPLIPGSLIKPDTISLLFDKPASQALILTVFRLVHLFFLLTTTFWLVKRLYKYRFKKAALSTDFFGMSIGVCLITILVLAFLSLRVAKAEDMPGNWWTFIQDPRYYGLPTILIHISLFAFFQYYVNKKRAAVAKYVFYLFFLLLFIEIVRGVVFTAKRISNWEKEEYSWQADLRFQKYTDDIIKKERKAGEKIVVAGSVYYVINRVSLYSHIPPLNDAGKINTLSSLKSKKPVLLLIILHEKHLDAFKPFISANSKQATGHFDGYNFYIVHIAPE